MFLLDTNVVSELRKPPRAIDPGVAAWGLSVDPELTFLSVITLFELDRGVRVVESRDSRQGRALRVWSEEELSPEFAKRLLLVDAAVARTAAGFDVPDRRPLADALIAATARVNGCQVVTRNERDFVGLVPTVNPWSA